MRLLRLVVASAHGHNFTRSQRGRLLAVVYDSHDFSSQSKLMKKFASPSWYLVAVNRNPDGTRLAWDGEVSFIRYTALGAMSPRWEE